jgi:hypothetical protein
MCFKCLHQFQFFTILEFIYMTYTSRISSNHTISIKSNRKRTNTNISRCIDSLSTFISNQIIYLYLPILITNYQVTPQWMQLNTIHSWIILILSFKPLCSQIKYFYIPIFTTPIHPILIKRESNSCNIVTETRVDCVSLRNVSFQVIDANALTTSCS